MGNLQMVIDGFSLPGDDGAIRQALADLEAKLAAWTSRMQESHERLRRLAPAERPQPASAAQPARQTEISPPVVPASVAAVERPTARQDAHVHGQDAPAAAACAATAGATGQVEKDVRPHGMVRPRGAEPPAAEKVVEPSADEALLASLDEKTAQAVRVLRRLNPGKKSLQALIEECRQSAQAEPAPAAKSSLWKRIRR